MITLLNPPNGQALPITGKETTDFLANLYRAHIAQDETVDPYKHILYLIEHEQNCTFPQPIVFTWDGEAGPYKFSISKNQDLSCPFISLTASEAGVKLCNFEIGTTYFWSVNGCPANSFYTADIFPRWIKAGGLTNVRDIGGRRNVDGHRIKQGLIFRGSEMDIHYTVTDEGIRCMTEQLHIKTDLDLRKEVIGVRDGSPLGNTVQYLLIPFEEYGKSVNETAPAADTIKKLFDVLANSSNYPIYVHCWGGADRTGTLIMLLQGALGVVDDDMLTDYELTCLGARDDRRRNDETRIAPMLRYLKTLNGVTLAQKIVSFLHACLVTDDIIQTIRDNLLE